jgi:hypothetical protein
MSRARAKATTRRARKRRSITKLYSDFEKAWEALTEIQAHSDDRRRTRALGKAGFLAQQIVEASATSVDEMLLKIRVTGWTIGARHKKLEDLDNWWPSRFARGEHFDALVSLRADLQRMKRWGDL